MRRAASRHQKVPLLLDGITLTPTAPKTAIRSSSVQISQFDGVKFVPVGGVINYEGKTPAYTTLAR